MLLPAPGLSSGFVRRAGARAEQGSKQGADGGEFPVSVHEGPQHGVAALYRRLHNAGGAERVDAVFQFGGAGAGSCGRWMNTDFGIMQCTPLRISTTCVTRQSPTMDDSA